MPPTPTPTPTHIHLALHSPSTPHSLLLPIRFSLATSSSSILTHELLVPVGPDLISVRFRQTTTGPAAGFVFETRKDSEGPFTYQLSCFEPEGEPGAQVSERVVRGESDYVVYVFAERGEEGEEGWEELVGWMGGLELGDGRMGKGEGGGERGCEGLMAVLEGLRLG
ncbi:hypothetical protein MMC13_000126 [Lambiella insularis]|nr:hypothetical protein [Lambiella insularis]